VIFKNCLGRSVLLLGQNLVPLPPAMMTAQQSSARDLSI
jgi:hypothetical protein